MHQEITAVYIGLSAIAALFFLALGYLIRKFHVKKKVKGAEDKAKKMIDTAKAEAEKAGMDRSNFKKILKILKGQNYYAKITQSFCYQRNVNHRAFYEHVGSSF